MYCTISCFKTHNEGKCYEQFCKTNVEQYLKAEKVKTLEEKAKAEKILFRNKRRNEQESTPQDQVAFERFNFFHNRESHQKVFLHLVVI